MFSMIGQSFRHSEHINGIRLLDRLKKFETVKVEIWLKEGSKGCKHSREQKETIDNIISEIEDFVVDLCSKATEITKDHIVLNDHFIKKKVSK